MIKQEILETFNNFYNGQKNFLTPRILGYYSNNDSSLIAEFSAGGGISGSLFCGITILEKHDGLWRTSDLSNAFNDFNEAREYLNNLKLIES